MDLPDQGGLLLHGRFVERQLVCFRVEQIAHDVADRRAAFKPQQEQLRALVVAAAGGMAKPVGRHDHRL